jgi:hypothetical protein
MPVDPIHGCETAGNESFADSETAVEVGFDRFDWSGGQRMKLHLRSQRPRFYLDDRPAPSGPAFETESILPMFSGHSR